MKFESLYRISFYIMLFLATLVLNIEDARENWVAWLLPPAVAATAVMAFLTVDRNPRYGLSLGAATLLSWLAIVLCYLEYRMDESRLIASLTHWLVYLQLIKMFRPKTDEDEWFLILIGLVQVMVGGVLSRGGDSVGILIIAWALWTIWTLGLFYLHRAARKATERARGRRNPKEGHYAGLIDKAFLTSSFSVAVGALLLGGLIFLLMPRSSSRGPLGLSGGGKAQTGFNSEEVSLKSAGRILENTAMVMTVALSGPDGESIGPLEEGDGGYEPLWRGSTLSRYEESAWVRENFKPKKRSFPESGNDKEKDTPQSLDGRDIGPSIRDWIRQDYALERLGETTRFALRPILKTQARGAGEGDPTRGVSDSLQVNVFDGSLAVPARSRIQEYSIWSGKAAPGVIQKSEITPKSLRPSPEKSFQIEIIEANLAIEDDLKGAFAAIAAEKLGGVPADRPKERAQALEAWLRDSGEFGYSLALSRTNTRIDPVLDFLTNHKRGHCVYYASSLALMLRSIGVPARIVNGYKGGDWNAISRRYHVRQKHAHSWVEALVPSPSGEAYYWMTLDPTPGASRDELVAQVGGSWFPGLRQLGEAMRYYWVFYIQGFDAERQQRMIYQPIKDMAEMAGRGYQMIWDAIRGRFQLTDLRSFFNVYGFILAFLTGTTLVLLVRVVRSAWKRLARWLGPGSSGKAGSAANIAFYQRLMALLSTQGLERAEAETPREFGARAIAQLTARCGDEQLFDVPRRVIEAFYRIRYGDEAISPDESRELRAGIDRLEQALLQPA